MKVLIGSGMLHSLQPSQMLVLESQNTQRAQPDGEYQVAPFVRCLQEAYPHQQDLMIPNRSKWGSWIDRNSNAPA